jgi:hypothetical protein
MPIKLVFTLRPQVLLQAPTTLNRTTTPNPTTTGNPTTTPNLTTIPKPKTPFGNITTPADETPENNTQSTQNRSTPDAHQEEIIERIASKYLFSELKNHVLSSEVHSGFLN